MLHIVLLIMAWSACCLIPSMPHLPRDNTNHNRLDPPDQSSVKKIPHRLAHGGGGGGASIFSSLCQVYIKTSQHIWLLLEMSEMMILQVTQSHPVASSRAKHRLLLSVEHVLSSSPVPALSSCTLPACSRSI